MGLVQYESSDEDEQVNIPEGDKVSETTHHRFKKMLILTLDQSSATLPESSASHSQDASGTIHQRTIPFPPGLDC